MTEAVLTLDNVAKRFGDFAAVDGLSFSVVRGEIFGFLGPNGAGKTTTLRMILDIIRPSSGRIGVLGAPSAIPVRRRIGYLPEERGLYRKMRAAETIAYFATLRGLSGKAARAKALELLDRFGLAAFARTKNEALSKGMAQKVQLLSTIAHEPELLILDEPFSGLDPINQATFEELVLSMRREGRTIIFSTHVMQHAERLCDRFLILAKGKKRFEGDMGKARAALPPRLIIRTRDAVERLRLAPGVRRVAPLGEEGGGHETDFDISL
ncbi:MAG: ABC transporter ATP-binding protein, partial [Amphiplicatus sp.]